MTCVSRSSQSGCRICGKLNGVFLDVLEKTSKQYLQQIRKFLQVEISSSDNFSKKICHNCLATLNEFAVLFDKCKAIQQDLNDSVNCSVRSQCVAVGEEESIYQNFVAVSDITDTIRQNVNALGDQSQLSKLVGCIVNENDPLVEFNSLNETKTLLINGKEENNSEKCYEKSDQFETPNCNDDWKIQKVPKSGVKLYLCNKCSAIYTCEEAKKAHKCSKAEDQFEMAKDSFKRPKSEPDYLNENFH